MVKSASRTTEGCGPFAVIILLAVGNEPFGKASTSVWGPYFVPLDASHQGLREALHPWLPSDAHPG